MNTKPFLWVSKLWHKNKKEKNPGFDIFIRSFNYYPCCQVELIPHTADKRHFGEDLNKFQ